MMSSSATSWEMEFAARPLSDECTSAFVRREHVTKGKNRMQSCLGSTLTCPDTAFGQSPEAAEAGTDYCLFDQWGNCLGTINATCTRPLLRKNAPTLYLRR